jgi:hypothetical protein
MKYSQKLKLQKELVKKLIFIHYFLKLLIKPSKGEQQRNLFEMRDCDSPMVDEIFLEVYFAFLFFKNF